MKSGICFTGTGPILFLTSCSSFTDENLIKKFKIKGINKFIAYEVPIDLVKEKYGGHFDVVLGDLHQDNDLRIVDHEGHHVFYQFSLAELGESTVYEEPAETENHEEHEKHAEHS